MAQNHDRIGQNIFLLFWICGALAPLFLLVFRFGAEISLFTKDIRLIFSSALTQSALSTLACLVTAAIPAYYAASQTTLSKLIRLTWIIPFFYPVISVIVAFSILYTAIPPFPRYSLVSVVIAHVFFNSPVLVRYLCEAFEAIPLTMREEAKLAGTGLLQRFLYLYLPLAAKPLCRGLFLTFVFCFTSFGVILSFGSLKITTPEVAIYSALSTNLNFSKALSVAIIQFLLIAALNVLVTMIPSYERETDTERPCHRPFWTALCSGIWLVFEFIIVLLPLVWAVRYSLQRNPQAILTLFSAGFNRNYPVLRSLANSTLLSCVSAALTSAFAWFLLSLRRKREEMLINALFGISPAMLAISLLYIAILLGLQTPLLLLWGYFIIALPYAYSFLQHQSARFDSAILEQSSVDGAGKLQRFIHIEWPLLSTSFRNVFMQLFAIFFGEFTIAYIFQNGSSFPLASVVSYQLAARRLDIESYLFTSLITFIVITICALFTFVFTDIKGDDKKPL